jgi:PIN domain nuclease of toxin-antitoxin system
LILLVDANALLWALSDSPELSPPARSAIEDSSNDVIVSAATVWELEVKRAAGKLRAPDDLVSALEASGMKTVPVTSIDAVRAARLPMHHRDPFDRMLVAQAQALDAVIVTRDRIIAAYDVHVLPA